MANKDHSLDSKITKAAIEEFYEYGFQKASLHKIAAKAEVTTGALYTRYKNKDALFSSLVEDVFTSFKPYVNEMMDKYKKAQDSKDVTSFIEAMHYEANIYFTVFYSHKKESILLFCKSNGSEAETFLKKMMLMKEESTVSFFEHLAKEKSERENNKEILEDFRIDKNAITMLMNMQFSLYNKILTLSLTESDARKCMNTMEEFVSFGWKNLFEKYL